MFSLEVWTMLCVTAHIVCELSILVSILAFQVL